MTTTIYTEIGRLNQLSKGKTVRILDLHDAKVTHEGTIEDLAHYLERPGQAEAVSSIRFVGEARAHFRLSSFMVEVDEPDHDDYEPDLLPAFEDGRLALMVGGRDAKSAALLSRQVINSAVFSIREALAVEVEKMIAALPHPDPAEAGDTDEAFDLGRVTALVEVAAWLRDEDLSEDEEAPGADNA